MGHFYLRRKIAGTLISVVVAGILLAMIVVFEMDAYRQVQQITNLKHYISHAPEMASHLWVQRQTFYKIGFSLLGLVWIGSAVDVFRIKKI